MNRIVQEWRLFVEKENKKISGIPVSRVTLRSRVMSGNDSYLSVDDALTQLSKQIEAIRAKEYVLKEQEIPHVIENIKEKLTFIKQDVDSILESFTKPVLKEDEVSALRRT